MATHTRHHRNTVTEAAVVDALSRHVAEIAFGIVEVVRVVVEEPRCKVSVTTTQPGVPAAAVCIGKAGAVARAVARDIGLEMVGIVTYSPDITTYLSNAISAHNVSPISVEVTDILSRKARMVFDNEPSAAGPSQLARAIGAQGSNVRLASGLTGWHLQLCSPDCVPGSYCNHQPRNSSTLPIAS
ncbi:hypothetical protein AB0876_31850 [Mycobacterium sp. NPDC049093]